MSEFARIAIVALLAMLAQSPQPAPPASPPQQQPRFRGGTNMVRVDAFATKDGVTVQDLKADDFEVFEDGAPQKIDSFEHIVIQPSQGEPVDPSSVSQAIQAAADPHRRVFVIYLDIEHVDVTASHDIKEPLIDLMNRVMSDDDLVAIMTPEMGPQQMTFARKTDVIERGLRENWAWGRRESIGLDDHEKQYDLCYPPKPGDTSSPSMSAAAREMIVRRRERIVLDSLYDLIHYMEAIREGRTAVIAVSDGWLLYGPHLGLIRQDPLEPLPGTPPSVGVGAGGTLKERPENGNTTEDRTECDKERFDLANLDDAPYFRNMLREANRANVSFYTIDPRGLAASDSFVLPPAPVPGRPDTTPLVNEDLASLKTRHDSLERLALDTDGIFLIDSNDLRKQLRRIADDLTSYYLIGYYSTDTKLDGTYRTIKVRSKRTGVDVRARQGYRAASAAEVNAARAAADLSVSEEKTAFTRALGTIESDPRAQRPDARGPGEPVMSHRGPSTGNQLQPATARIFPRSDRLHLELEAAPGSGTWMGTVLDRNGKKTAVPVTVGERTDSASGQRWLSADITLAPLGAGDYVIELTSTTGTEQRRTLVAIRVTQ